MKQETLEEAAKNISELGEYDRSFESTRKNYFIQGANWQKERMYSEEDLKSAFFNGGDMKDLEEFNYWLEEFKKKKL